MTIEEIGRLHFKVSSRSRRGGPHLVDLEPQDGDPYFCACDKFTRHPLYHGRPCHHLAAVVAFLQRKLNRA